MEQGKENEVAQQNVGALIDAIVAKVEARQAEKSAGATTINVAQPSSEQAASCDGSVGMSDTTKTALLAALMPIMASLGHSGGNAPIPPESVETQSAMDQAEDAWAFNYKSLVEQHEKFLASLNKQAQNNLEQLNSVGLQIVQNAVVVANRIQHNAAETDNMIAKQSFRNVSYENASIWQLPSIDAIASAVAEKLASTISPTIPGPSTSPGVAGSGVNAQNTTTGG